MAESVLRSAMGEAGLGELVDVDSTAITREEVGSGIDRRAARVLTAAGFDPLAGHRARLVTAQQLGERDLVLPMTAQHAHYLRRVRPIGTRTPVIRMYRTFDPAVTATDVAADLRAWDIADPWYGGPDDFDITLDELRAGAAGIVAWARNAAERTGLSRATR